MSFIDGFDLTSENYAFLDESTDDNLFFDGLTYGAADGPYGEPTLTGKYKSFSVPPTIESRARILTDLPSGSKMGVHFHCQGDRYFTVRTFDAPGGISFDIDFDLPAMGYNRPADWHWVSIYMELGAGYTVQLDGTQILSGTTGSVVGTIGDLVFARKFKIANLHITDENGASYNGHLEERRFLRLVPSSDGNYGQFTALAGGDHFEEIDETNADADTSYVQSGTVGHKDSYGFTDVPSLLNPDLQQVKVDLIAKKTDVATTQLKLFRRAASVDSDLVTKTLLANYTRFNHVLGPLTETEANALELGVEVVSA